MADIALGESKQFDYTGNVQKITLFPGIYKIECYGASGGTSYPGLGGYTSGILQIFQIHDFFIYVGGKGQYARVCVGGWNGGGSANNVNSASGSGGGASDIRLVSGEWNDLDSLRSRIMVAGGGGGGGRYQGKGGNGGGLTGSNGNGATGGTQTAGGRSNGKFGIGANGPTTNYGKGCGGGGYYGGGTNASGDSYYHSGGGGSSFISGMEGCDAIDRNGNHTGQPIHYSGLYFTECKTQAGVNQGHGYVVITFIFENEKYDIITNQDIVVPNKTKAHQTETVSVVCNKDAYTCIRKWIINPSIDYTRINKTTIEFIMPSSDVNVGVMLEPNRLNANIYKNIFPEAVTNMNYINDVLDNTPTTLSDVVQANHGLELYDIVYKDKNGKYQKALAEDSKKAIAVGMVTKVSSPNVFTLMTTGKIEYQYLDYDDTSILYLSDKEPGKFVHYTSITNTVYIPVAIYTNNSIIINLQQGSIGDTLAPYTIEQTEFELYTQNELNDVIGQIVNGVK